MIWLQPNLFGTPGVDSFDIDMKEQKVTVIGNVQPESVLQTVSKTGKKTAFWEAEAGTVPKKAEAETVDKKVEEETGAKEPVAPA